MANYVKVVDYMLTVSR